MSKTSFKHSHVCKGERKKDDVNKPVKKCVLYPEQAKEIQNI